MENWRTSQFRETIGVKDNECVEPTDTAAGTRDDGDLCSQSKVIVVVVTQTREENGNNIIIYVVTFNPYDRHNLQYICGVRRPEFIVDPKWFFVFLLIL